MKAQLSVGSLAFILAACGGSSKSPTAPEAPPAPLPQLSIQIAPNPLRASLAAATQTGATFRIAADVTFRETAGAGGQITQITGTVTRQPGGQTTTGSLSVTLQVPSSGSVVDSLTQDFEVTAGVESISWRMTASGVDSTGRSFTATSDSIAVMPPAIPPPSVPTPARYELWGGRNYTVYLGCFSCNEFDSESVFNPFGTYGGRYSPTSVANRFSDYGSPFAPDSACNPFATNPPILLNTASRTYTELTLNQFRPFAERDANILAALRNNLCAS